MACGDVRPFFGGTLIPAPYEEYEKQSKKLPETLFIRRHGMENILRKFVLSPAKGSRNIHTVAGTVRALERNDGGSKINAIVVRKPDGGEITINDPTLVVGESLFTYHYLLPYSTSVYRLFRGQPSWPQVASQGRV